VLGLKLESGYLFVVVDAMFTKVRTEKRVVSKALLIAGGIRNDGYRDVLCLAIGDAESFATWDELLKRLKDRGLSNVDFVIPDDHRRLILRYNRKSQKLSCSNSSRARSSMRIATSSSADLPVWARVTS
jgi:hypothetical protein